MAWGIYDPDDDKVDPMKYSPLSYSPDLPVGARFISGGEVVEYVGPSFNLKSGKQKLVRVLTGPQAGQEIRIS